MKQSRSLWTLLAVMLVLSLVLAACGKQEAPCPLLRLMKNLPLWVISIVPV